MGWPEKKCHPSHSRNCPRYFHLQYTIHEALYKQGLSKEVQEWLFPYMNALESQVNSAFSCKRTRVPKQYNGGNGTQLCLHIVYPPTPQHYIHASMFIYASISNLFTNCSLILKKKVLSLQVRNPYHWRQRESDTFSKLQSDSSKSCLISKHQSSGLK